MQKFDYITVGTTVVNNQSIAQLCVRRVLKAIEAFASQHSFKPLRTDRDVLGRTAEKIIPMSKAIALLASLAVAATAAAGDFTVPPVTISIPSGFEGPIRQEQSGATMVAFTKTNGSTAKTLLQISLYDFAEQLKKMNDAERAIAAKKYLIDFVGGIERRRTNFKRTEPSPIQIGGLPAAKLQWTGLVQKLETVGVMYCFVVGTTIISFHTQDAGSTPTAAMGEAMQAFENAKIDNGG